MDTEHLKDLLEQLHLEYPQHGWVSKEEAKRWDDGSVVGNGVQGALAFCRPYDEEVILSHEELFVPLFPFAGYLPVKKHLPRIRELVYEGKAVEAQDLIREIKTEHDFPAYNTTDPFVGAASIKLCLFPEGEVKAYLRSQDFSTGESKVSWMDDGGVVQRSSFFSRQDDVYVVKTHSPTGRKLNMRVELGPIHYEEPSDPLDRNIRDLTIEKSVVGSSENFLCHQLLFKNRYDEQEILGCETLVRVTCSGGELMTQDGMIEVKGANSIVIISRTLPYRRADGKGSTLQDSLEMSSACYEELLTRHLEKHSEIFGRCQLALGSESPLVTAECLKSSSRVGRTSLALTNKVFEAARYGILSSTGNLPPLLQGVWTGTWKPRWSGDYTLNGNVQAMVASSLIGNHYECQEALMDYLDGLMDDFRDNARHLLGFRGPLIPWRSSTHGKTHYLAYRQYHHDFPGVYWFAGAGWFVQIYFEYYLHTGDETFLNDRLIPFLRETIEFYEDYLVMEKDGELVLSPSSSPENETSENVWMAPNATMTIAVIRQVLRTAMDLRVELGATDQDLRKWKELLSKMPNYQIGKNGALKEWTLPELENEEAHRHASHLYPLYFGVEDEFRNSAELKEASRVAIERRMVERRKEEGGDMAFGWVQLGMAAAHLGEKDLAYEALEYLVNQYWSSALVSLHNVGDVFNLDISGGLPALIITMLVQSDRTKEPWRITLLPCLPKEWRDGRLKGVRCRGGFEINLSWKEGVLDEVEMISHRGQEAVLVIGEREVWLALGKGERISLNGRFEKVS